MNNLQDGYEKHDSHKELSSIKLIQGKEAQVKNQLQQVISNFQRENLTPESKKLELQKKACIKYQDKNSKVIVIRVDDEQELLQIMDALSEIQRKKNKKIPKSIGVLSDTTNLIQLQSMSERRKKGKKMKNKKEKQNICGISNSERSEKTNEMLQNSSNNENMSKEEIEKNSVKENYLQSISALYSSSNFTSVVQQESDVMMESLKNSQIVEGQPESFLNEAFLEDPLEQQIIEAEDPDIFSSQKIEEQQGKQKKMQNNQLKVEQKIQQYEKADTPKIYTFHEQKKGSFQNQEWYHYLKKLSYAQTELTYLGQQMNWTVKFFQGISSTATNLFECNVQIVVISSLIVKKIKGFCKAEKSKKEAKHHASIKCLAQLYSTIAGLFTKYKTLKEETPALKQPEKSDNTQILESWGKKNLGNLNQLIDLQNYENQLDYKPDVNSYVKNLKCCKKQLYYFIAQNNKIFMPPKWNIKKSNYIGFWQAQGWVRFELNNLIYEYRFKSQARNKKEAEEKVSEYLLKQMYNDFPYLFKKFKQVKILKGLI